MRSEVKIKKNQLTEYTFRSNLLNELENQVFSSQPHLFPFSPLHVSSLPSYLYDQESIDH